MPAGGSVLPIKGSVDVEAPPTVLPLEAAGPALESLSSATARAIVERVFAAPATASVLAESADTSLQNVQHHLGRLREAGLIEPVDTWYSARGTEMTVYGPAAEPLVICAGVTGDGVELRRALGGDDGARRVSPPSD